MSFAVGSLVRARGREWIVLPESQPAEQLLILRPLGGTDDEITGIYTPLEPIEPAQFTLPDPERDRGNHLSAQLLQGALRLGFRAGAGPFRCLARVAVEPRPFQLVPLLMALQLDPVRLLIADDVGVGKTIEALLIARELLDRAEIHGLAVLCPPHLAEQWQRTMADFFHLDATLVLAGTAGRLEREIPPGESIFEHHPITVVSLDYIKSDRRRSQFLRACPELVIVDEAHTCTAGNARGNQRRHELLRQVAEAATRHLI
ncbi:MAG: DEAD/DEAH box helicase, partial [Deltaproteobacteria bacterium]|nr:DEAD/DEAH box helicase [Deltaproteobacteria bacterium]